MPRNMDYRIEVTCPVFDENIKTEIIRIFNIQWNDNVKARIFDERQSNKFVQENKHKNSSQIEVYNYLNRNKYKSSGSSIKLP